MKSFELRQLFLDFFKEKGHNIIESSPLIPTDDSVLFTSAGMQQFKDYYLDKVSPFGSNVASCQKCVRTSDIEEVGDERHLTFFEMLGNFSFGGYFKENAIKLAYEFVVEKLELEIDYVTIFSPDKIEKNDWRKEVEEDKESFQIWESLGVSNIVKEGVDNFWGPTGKEGPCGPTTEIYVKNGEGKSIEIWNIVFNEFFCDENKKLEKLKQPGVDTGMGLERLIVVKNKVPTVFETDLFEPIIKELENQSKVKYNDNAIYFRIIADHIKSAVFLASEGIIPSNIEQGYVLRRLLRRAIRYGKLLKLKDNFLSDLAKKSIDIYIDVYPELKEKEDSVLEVIKNEEIKFEETIEHGLKELKSQISLLDSKIIPGKIVFDLYQSYGFPLELTRELAKEQGFEIEETDFEKEFKKHQDISRAGAEKKFGGVGKDASEESKRLHTATHLLHQALREVLGDHVRQMGSDITPERLRFDFSHTAKMTPEEIKKVEDLVNEKIKEDLEVKREEMSYDEAIRGGALAFFKEKYPEKVSVYSVGNFSKEICAGPHAKRTGELGHFKIIKEESSSAGVRRIKAGLT